MINKSAYFRPVLVVWLTLGMQFRLILALFMLAGITCAGQDLSSLGAPDSTLFYLDSVETGSAMPGLSPDNIAMISVVKFRNLRSYQGVFRINSYVYIETKPFARRRYNKMFSELSPAYAAALKKYGTDTGFQYILDGAVLTSSIEPMLAAMETKGIADISVIDPKQLKKQYQVEDRQVGVVIRSK
jgi:hypothetical protein